MTREQETDLRNFEARVRQLMSAYADLSRENVKLKAKLQETSQALSDAKDENARLKHDYQTLKTARMLEVSGEDVKASRARIAKLIREVDKCISLLEV